MTALFHLLISTPFYNGLILLMDLLPFFDVGVIIVIFTIIVKVIILPLSIKASKSQLEMKSTEKDLAVIKEQYKNKEEQSRKIMEYYKERNINPFAGFFVLIIQLPILIGLYQVFMHSGFINPTIPLYSFVSQPNPESINMFFLGLINISQKSLILALLAGITTYIQISFSNQSQGVDSKKSDGSSHGDIARAMQTQMKYFFPVLMTVIAYSISSGIAIYFITSNLFAIAQEVYIKKRYHKSIVVV